MNYHLQDVCDPSKTIWLRPAHERTADFFSTMDFAEALRVNDNTAKYQQDAPGDSMGHFICNQAMLSVKEFFTRPHHPLCLERILLSSRNKRDKARLGL